MTHPSPPRPPSEPGADQKRVRLRAIGPDGNDEGFAVRFPNGLVLDVVPQGTALHVSDRSGKYSTTFEWQYEGPVDGRGTFCTPCVEGADAIGYVRRNFRSDELRVGTEGVSTCCFRWSQYHSKK